MWLILYIPCSKSFFLVDLLLITSVIHSYKSDRFYERITLGKDFKFKYDFHWHNISYSLNGNYRVKGDSLILDSNPQRDKLIVKALVNNNIKKVYDIGGDRGGLAQLLKLDGIDVTVFEPRSDSVEYMKLHNIDCKEISVQELTKNFKDYISCGPETAIVCLNFTHAKWKNENEKKENC